MLEEGKKQIDNKDSLPENLILYHGSNEKVSLPKVDCGRTDVDFGKGFYLTADLDMASKWACRKAISIVSEYKISLKGLKVYKFKADKEWLDFVMSNRNMYPFPEKYKSYDVLIGPTADDRLFNTLELYEDGLVSAKDAIKVINCMNYSLQYVVRTDVAVKKLSFTKSIQLVDNQKQKYINKYRQDRIQANKRTKELFEKINKERG